MQAELERLAARAAQPAARVGARGTGRERQRGSAPLGRAAHVRLQAEGPRRARRAARGPGLRGRREISGARFVVMRSQVARLHRALAQFMLDLHTREHGYTEVYVPYLVNAAGAASAPASCRSSRRTCSRVQGEQTFYLIPTAEVPVTNLVREQIVAGGSAAAEVRLRTRRASAPKRAPPARTRAA